ncbi:carboxypeptidase M32 [Planktotalea arctica]|uniref:carboxypeptidase M32 n=1 Tax=Planktotalea arctica TaxID=1481893 RepID=UPI000A16CFA4|nr:carboxypeptidase M32 [Planktotalea arctica]
MSAYDDLMAHQRETEALGAVMGRLGWDQETVMPRGAAPQRAEEMAALEGVLHARRTDARIGEWLCNAQAPDEAGKAQLRLITKSYERAQKVPADLAQALAKLTSASQGIWAQAREDEDIAAFLPTLKEVVALKREEGAALAAGGDVYDAMLQDYEPGASSDSLSAMFAALRPRLTALRDQVMAHEQPADLDFDFDEGKQMKLTRKLAKTFGYDMSHGRVDKAVHPFSSGSGQDVRITTRTSARDPFNCLYSTIHEVGHACYEQGISKDYLLTPLGSGVSMGVHESQSRIYENQMGRSRAFCGWLYGQMRDAFGDFGVADEDTFYRTVNKLRSGFIRTEADEVQYNLHVLLRFDLERALISGDLAVDDLEAAWNDRFAADFGYGVDKPSNGLLQDVHWSVGLFGYFATYSLGNVYAGCLNAAMRADLPDFDASLAIGDPSLGTEWLNEALQRHGGLREPRATIAHACSGTEPSEGPLLDYLEAKFTRLAV